MRRRQSSVAKQTPYAKAYDQINVLELASVHQLVHVDWTLDDLVEWLWDEDTVAKLRAAHGLAYVYNQRYSETFKVVPGLTCSFSIDMEAAEMPRPAEGLASPQIDRGRGKDILASLTTAYEVHKDFERVRLVVRWCDEHATPSAARYYFPSLMGLLPLEHPIHHASAERFREPAGVGPMIQNMRKASQTLAGALLCPKEVPNRPHFKVSFYSSEAEAGSQLFGFI